MQPVINARYEVMFRWLAEQDLDKYSNLSNKLLYQLYIEANHLKERVNNFRKNSEKMAEMIHASSEFSVAKKAKLFIFLNIPIKDERLLETLRKEDKNIVLRPIDHTIWMFRSNNGEVVYHGNEMRKLAIRAPDPNRNKGAKKRATLEEYSSHDFLLENQEPRAKKARSDPTGCPSTSNENQHSSNSASTNQIDLLPTDYNSIPIESRNQVLNNYYGWVQEMEGQSATTSNSKFVGAAGHDEPVSDEVFGQEDAVTGPVPTQIAEVNAASTSPSCSSTSQNYEKHEQLLLPKFEETPSPAPPPLELPPVKETPLVKMKNFNSSTNRNKVFEFLKLFALCLKDFDHLVPEAVDMMMSALKENLYLFSAANQNGILVKEVLEDFYYLISHWCGTSKILMRIHQNWKTDGQSDDKNEKFIPFDLLQMVLIDIIESLPSKTV
ncbi:hypothetical protein CAEBREN_04557 [Caenorhabditis brenneri]|uniref:SPK domain-containing protein n=1 Tax=Caenorhabditis brenneri TaxID=135651 RepID=G0MQZ5_CAEBE|nr:hypothetical protein CAEBREN_04557 [Caenorhabditis brenneri]